MYPLELLGEGGIDLLTGLKDPEINGVETLLWRDFPEEGKRVLFARTRPFSGRPHMFSVHSSLSCTFLGGKFRAVYNTPQEAVGKQVGSQFILEPGSTLVAVEGAIDGIEGSFERALFANKRSGHQFVAGSIENIGFIPVDESWVVVVAGIDTENPKESAPVEGEVMTEQEIEECLRELRTYLNVNL